MTPSILGVHHVRITVERAQEQATCRFYSGGSSCDPFRNRVEFIQPE